MQRTEKVVLSVYRCGAAKIRITSDMVGRGSEGLGSYCWLEGGHAWADRNIGRDGVPHTNGSGVKGVDIDIGSALDLYMFMGGY